MRCIRQTGVNVYFRPTNTLRSQSVHPKDKVSPLEQSGVVYKILCNDCPEKYMGETERVLITCCNQNQRPSLSSVGHHIQYQRHSINNVNVYILCRETDWFKRGVAKAIHIQRESPTLNHKRECHTPPSIYQELLSNCYQ